MKIAVIGVGAIGSTFAYKLSQAGHDVTVIARGIRLEQLKQTKAIEDIHGNRAQVQVADALNAGTPWDLVLVTVLSHQVDTLLPALASSSAQKVMFMFNTFRSLDTFRNAVGPNRFEFGFPAIIAKLEDGKLNSKIVTRGYVTVATDAVTAKAFAEAGIPAVLEKDMQSWLRTHAAAMVPIMRVAHLAQERGGGVSWSEASSEAQAMKAGFDLVRQLGNQVTPRSVAALSCLPLSFIASLLWAMSRVRLVTDLGPSVASESRALLEEMKTSRM